MAGASPFSTTLRPTTDSGSDDFYISELTITSITDGTADFDECTDVDCQDCGYYYAAQGNDSGPNNGIVRSFDTVSYTLSYTAEAHTAGTTTTSAYLYFEFVLPLSETEAEWDLDAMAWIYSGSYQITTEYRSYDFNGDGAVETNVECQVLRGARYIYSADGQAVLPTSSSLQAVVQILASSNGTKVTPVFSLWVEGNKAGETTLHDTELVAGNTATCENHGIVEYATAEANGVYGTDANYTVEVTAELRLNVDAETHTSTTYRNSYFVIDTYDLENTGNELALDSEAGEVYGRSSVYGITLMLYNYEGKGLKGIEYPTGDIEIELEFATDFYLSDGSLVSEASDYVMDYYTPLVLSWGQIGSQADERLDDITDYYYGRALGPYSTRMTTSTSLTSATYRAYGDKTVKASKTSTTTVTFTVSDYDILYPYFPSDGYYRTFYAASTGLENIGAFASMALYLLTPFENNTTGADVITDLNNEFSLGLTSEDDGYFVTTVEVADISATSASGDNSVDDAADLMDESYKSASAHLDLTTLPTAAVVSRRVAWTKYSPSSFNYNTFSDVLGRNSSTTGSWAANGRDVLTVGSTVGIGGGLYYANSGNSSNKVYAADVLVKFDGDAVTPTGNWISYDDYLETAGLEASVLWATLPGGENWASDSDMNSATIESLVYYSDINDVPSGAVIVAYLLELRPKDGDVSNVEDAAWGSDGFVNLSAIIEATINSDESLLGKVYQCVVGVKYWEVDEWSKALTAADGDVESAVPTMAGHGQSNGSGGTTTVTLPDDSCTSYASYTKTVYGDNGIESESTAFTAGDSLLIADALTSITKSVAQTTNAGASTKSSYDLDNGERIVDYQLTSSWSAIPSTPRTTTITITDTLDEGLTYVPGSAYVGGTYQEASLEGRQGTVVGGTQSDPIDITTNSDGTTILTWVLEVDTDEEIPTIYYSARIGEEGNEDDDITIGDTVSLSNGATIATYYDKRAASTGTGNYSTVTISTYRYGAASLVKTVADSVYDSGEEMSYALTANATQALSDTVLLDVLPYNGDDYNTSFTGSLYVTGTSLTTSGLTDASSWKVYYTTSTAVQGTTASDHAAASIAQGSTTVGSGTVTWVEASLDTTTGAITGIPDTGTVTAIAFVGDLANADTFRASLTLKTDTTAKAGDVLVNTFTQTDVTLVGTATTYIANRTITGQAWNDASADGQRASGEDGLEDVTVTLYDDEGDPVEDTDENEVSLVTGSDTTTEYAVTVDGTTHTITATASTDGSYTFSGLPAGTYSVRFDSSSSTDLNFANLAARPQNAVTGTGGDYVDSDATASYDMTTGKLTHTQIDDIVLPAASAMSVANYTSSFNDSGLYYCGTLTVTKKVDGLNPDTSKTFSFTVTLGTSINGSFGDLTFTDGVATVTLADDGSVKATRLPVGTYIVEETSYTTDGYSTSYVIDSGSSINGSKAEDSITAGNDSVVTFTNTRETGTITVSKTTTGQDADTSKAFTFTVTLDDDSISGDASTYGVAFEDGTATFTLANGDEQTITLPAGVSYSVEEADYTSDGYSTTYQLNSSGTDVADRKAEGTVSIGSSATIAYTNTRGSGDLTITKALDGDGALAGDTFVFTVTVDTEADGTYEIEYSNGNTGTVTFENGALTKVAITGEDDATAIYLKGGESAIIKNLTAGVAYTVVETASAGYTASYEVDSSGSSTTGDTATGSIAIDTGAAVVFTNYRGTGDLTISNTLDGNNPSATQEFEFTVSIDSEADGEYTITFSDARTGTVTFEGGALTKVTIEGDEGEYTTISLKGGEYVTIEGLPEELTYTVTQVANENYTTTYTTDGGASTETGTTATGTITKDETLEVAFTNTRESGAGLEVSTKLSGDGASTEDVFSLTITLDEAITGNYSVTYYDEDGLMDTTEQLSLTDADSITLTLTGGQSVVIEGLPAGVGYSIEIAGPTGYVFTLEEGSAQGSIAVDEAKTVVFSAHRDPDPVLSIEKEVADSITTAQAGDTINYTVTVTQTVANATATGVVVTDTLSEGFTHNKDSIKVYLGGADITSSASIQTADNVLTVAIDDELTYNETLVITYSVTIGEDAVGQTLTNTATVTCNEDAGGDGSAGSGSTVSSSAGEITIVAADDGSSSASTGSGSGSGSLPQTGDANTALLLGSASTLGLSALVIAFALLQRRRSKNQGAHMRK